MHHQHCASQWGLLFTRISLRSRYCLSPWISARAATVAIREKVDRNRKSAWPLWSLCVPSNLGYSIISWHYTKGNTSAYVHPMQQSEDIPDKELGESSWKAGNRPGREQHQGICPSEPRKRAQAHCCSQQDEPAVPCGMTAESFLLSCRSRSWTIPRAMPAARSHPAHEQSTPLVAVSRIQVKPTYRTLRLVNYLQSLQHFIGRYGEHPQI